MIILVAVTLNIALGENGLIAKAKETRTKQEEQTIYEDIQGMMELNNNGEIEVDKTVDNVKAKYPGTELSGTTLTVPGQYGIYKYKITASKIEKDDNKKETDLKYFYDDSNKGILILNNQKVLFGVGNNETFIPLIEGYVKNNAEITVGNETKKYNNAIFISEPTLNPKYNRLYGYIEENKVTGVNVEFSDEENNIDSQTKDIIQYTKIEESASIELTKDYPGNNISGNIYISENEDSYISVDLDKKIYSMGSFADSVYLPFAKANCFIKEDTVISLDDGTSIDYTGKQVLFGEILTNLTVNKGQYEPKGYIDGNKLIVFNSIISASEEQNGITIPKTYSSFKEAENFIK